MFIGRTDVEAETPILWPPDTKSWLILKRPWCWERLRAGGEGDDRGWDGWMASPPRWMWVWVDSRSWCWTGRPGMLRFIGSQRVRHDWATELNWTGVISVPENLGHIKFCSAIQIWFSFQLKFCIYTQLSPFSVFSSLKCPPNEKLGWEVANRKHKQSLINYFPKSYLNKLWEFSIYFFYLKKKML